MQQGGTDPIEAIGPLLKILKERQQLYFELLYFVNRHFEASCDDFDNLTIFNGFLKNVYDKHIRQQEKEAELIDSFDLLEDPNYILDEVMSKNLERLTNRIIENLDSSVSRARKTIFDDGHLTHQFTDFKKKLQKIIKHDIFVPQFFMKHVLGYCIKKYEKQVAKVEQYLQIVERGSDICLKEIYYKETKQQPKTQELRLPSTSPRKKIIKIQVKQQLSEEESSPEKKGSSLKKVKLSTKRRISKKAKEDDSNQSKMQKTANQLYKYYSTLQLNKPQFYEDYIYNQIEEDHHRTQIMNKLRERNKTINGQIDVYVKEVSHAVIKDLNQKQSSHASSGEDKVQLPLTKKLSSHRNFTIKRKSSAHFDSSSGNEKHSETQRTALSNSIRNINPRRKSSQSNHRPVEKSQQKCFVVQQPKIFEDQVIPQMPLTFATNQRFNPTRTMRPKEKKNQNLRLKRLNNPVPMQNTYLQKYHP